jgi:hypothetical protein
MRDHLPWLGQGDIFASAPIVDVTLTDTGHVQSTVIEGPAVLLTHDCDMDKPDNATGQPRIERMQFAKLRAVDALPASYQRTLRTNRNNPGPFEALYLGDIANLGECCVLLSDPYYIPSTYFIPTFGDYSDHPEGAEGARYTTIQLHDSRLGRLDETQLILLRRKMAAFWTRLDPGEPPS